MTPLKIIPLKYFSKNSDNLSLARLRKKNMLTEEKNQVFIQCETLEEAWKIAPWAYKIVEVEGGFRAFKFVSDYEIWIAAI